MSVDICLPYVYMNVFFIINFAIDILVHNILKNMEAEDPKEVANLFAKIAMILTQPQMKDLIRKTIISQLWKAVNIIRNVLCQQADCKPQQLQQNIYDWSYVKFKQRMEVRRIYIDKLYHLDPKSLDNLKVSTDLRNLIDFLQLLYDGSVALCLTKLRGCQKLEYVREDVALRHWVHTKILQRLTDENNTFHEYETQVIQKITMDIFKTMDEGNDSWLVGDPISVRYQCKFLRIETEIEEHKHESLVMQAKSKLDLASKESAQNLAMSETMLGFYVNQITEFREQINFWTDKYDRDYEKVCQSVQNRKFKLQVLEQQRRDHEARIEFYRKEVKRQIEEDLKNLTQQHILQKQHKLDQEHTLQQPQKRRSSQGRKRLKKTK